ncbi:DUF7472 family protein [Natrialbaceae archaeon AArc-T1-2]|uniref:DUF7472 family protein n=1 Tax=Natrialbaceae archaeon AArc-T1-2 TaxID=3053904 RepID=UPI00255A98ED|nr:hypothetical protein [Natrialbaceae archaeon AArc-T1-2]WIV67810.1 hypothetical protein QQ977_03505 [Natrialbaceae archaeon AArc-T1-2]
MPDREQLTEIVVAVGSVFLMIGVMIVIGTNYGTNAGLTEEGGTALVGAIVGFILLLTVVGVGLAFVLNDPEDGIEEDTNGEATA